MGKARKPKPLIGDFLNLLYSLVLIIAIKVYLKTHSAVWGISTFAIGVIALFVILSIYRSWREQRLRASGLDIVDRMSGEEFEEFLLSHFRNLGYKGSLTPKMEDYGADLILEKDGIRTVVQAKRWKQTVDIEAVQQVIGAIKHYNASKAIVITNSYLSENAHKLAESNGVELWNREKLIELMNKSGGRDIAQIVSSSSSIVKEQLAVTSNEKCPRCGGDLVRRNGKNGQFWGCSNFPKCRFTRN